jgi:general secretion pathway protein B
VVVGVGAGLLLPLLWHWWSLDPVAEEAVIAARTPVAGNVTAQAATPAVSPPPAPAASAAAEAAVPAATAPAATAPAATNEPAAPRAARAPAKAGAAAPKAGASATDQAPARAQAAQRQATTGKPAPVPAGKNTVAAAPAAASAPEPKLRSLNEMPDDVRRSVPQLSFGGSVYSEVAAQRMVILNGQVLREGDAVTDELQVEQIRPRSAVMRVRGQRFEIPF